jgi:hypothetical protein
VFYVPLAKDLFVHCMICNRELNNFGLHAKRVLERRVDGPRQSDQAVSCGVTWTGMNLEGLGRGMFKVLYRPRFEPSTSRIQD